MGVHRKRVVALACLLVAFAGLTRVVAGAGPRSFQNGPPPWVNGPRPLDGVPPPILLRPEDVSKLLKKNLYVIKPEKEQKELQSCLRWIHWILMLIVAAAGGFGVGQAISKRCAHPTDTGQTRVEELGLGADGKDGVWRRVIRPWEK